jgi:thioredoxin 1
MTIVNINENNFEKEVVKSSLPCLVDFWAEWCGPCKNLAPILDEISNELKEKVKIGKINIDDNQELAAKFSIRSIPTMILFKDGNSIDTKVGLPPKKELLDWIETKI